MILMRKQRCVFLELTDKKSSTQAAVEMKENGVTTETKDLATKINPIKKSRKHRFFKSKEVTLKPQSNQGEAVTLYYRGYLKL